PIVSDNRDTCASTAATFFPYSTLFRSPEVLHYQWPARLSRWSSRSSTGGVVGCRPLQRGLSSPDVVHVMVNGNRRHHRSTNVSSDRKSKRLNTSHRTISHAAICMKKKT